MDSEWRRWLFRRLGSLHDPGEREHGDLPIQQAAFSTFLKAMLTTRPERRPGFGLSHAGNLIAAWVNASDRLTEEFLPNDRVRWTLSMSGEDGSFDTRATHQCRTVRTVLPGTIHNIGLYVPKKAANIGDEDHVTRHVRWTRLLKDENDQVPLVLPQAFDRRAAEAALSVSWVEYYDNAATRVRDAVWGARHARKIGANSAFAVGNVGEIKETCRTVSNARIRVVSEPPDNRPAQAGLRHLPHDDFDLLEAPAPEAFTEMVLNQDITTEPQDRATDDEGAAP